MYIYIYTDDEPRHWATWMYLDPSGPHSKSQGLSLELIQTSEAPLFSPRASPLFSCDLSRFIAGSLLPGLPENARRSSSRWAPQRSSIHRPLGGLMPFSILFLLPFSPSLLFFLSCLAFFFLR